MQRKMSPIDCQIKRVDQMAEPLGKFKFLLQLRFKIKRVVKRRIRFVQNWLRSIGGGAKAPTEVKGATARQLFVAGQLVSVRSRVEIQATLDNWNMLKGCGFMEEMRQYSDTNHRIMKPVYRFVDERDHRLKKARGIFFLEGVHCEGTIDYGRCDRNCFYFWREEWLEAVE